MKTNKMDLFINMKLTKETFKNYEEVHNVKPLEFCYCF